MVKKLVKWIAVYRSDYISVTPCPAYTLHYTSSNLKSIRKTKGRQVPKNLPTMMLSQTDLLLVVHCFEIPEKRTVAKLTVVTLIPISRLKTKMYLKCNVSVVAKKVMHNENFSIRLPLLVLQPCSRVLDFRLLHKTWAFLMLQDMTFNIS